MSIEKRNTGYTVRWRDSAGRQRSQQVQLWRDAVALDGELKRKRAMGELIAHEKGKITLNDFWEVWWTNHAIPNLSPRTCDVYSRLYSKHLRPPLGASPIRLVTSERISTLVSSLSTRLSPASLRKVLAILQSVLQRAVEWEYVATNACRGVKRPALVGQRRGRALSTSQIESVVSELRDLRSRCFVKTLAWSGLRPGELRALRWQDLSSGLIRVERAMSCNVIGPTKTRSKRSVEFRSEPRAILMEWYVARGQPSTGELIFGTWSDNAYRLWQRNVFKPAAARAGLAGLRPYDLRHTFASRLIAEGRNPIEVARQLGHSPVLTLETYAHEFEDQRKSVRDECAEDIGIVGILSARRGI